MRRSNYDHILEINYFCNIFAKQLQNNPYHNMLTDFANLQTKSRSEYRKVCMKYQIYKFPLYRKLGQLYYAHH